MAQNTQESIIFIVKKANYSVPWYLNFVSLRELIIVT